MTEFAISISSPREEKICTLTDEGSVLCLSASPSSGLSNSLLKISTRGKTNLLKNKNFEDSESSSDEMEPEGVKLNLSPAQLKNSESEDEEDELDDELNPNLREEFKLKLEDDEEGNLKLKSKDGDEEIGSVSKATESIAFPSSARSAASLKIFSGRDSSSSLASTVSESEELKLEEAVERLEQAAESISSRIDGNPGTNPFVQSVASKLEQSSETDFSNISLPPNPQEHIDTNPFSQPLSDVESCSNCSEVGETETDSFPDIIFQPSAEHSNSSTVRISDRSNTSTVSSGVVLMASENEESDYDQTKNPFSPYFKPTKKIFQINPFENSNLVTDDFRNIPNIPKLDFQINEQYSIPSRPSEALASIAKTQNPFRLEAWADPRESKTARIEKDSTFSTFLHDPNFLSISKNEENAESNEPEDFWNPKEGSHSAPSTQRKLAPCAVNYSEFNDFLNSESLLSSIPGLMEFEDQKVKYYPDGCLTVRFLSLFFNFLQKRIDILKLSQFFKKEQFSLSHNIGETTPTEQIRELFSQSA